MPPRKEPKENVVYPASKRKAPPFKPLKPSKLAKNETASSYKAAAPKVASKLDVRKPASKKATVPATKASNSITLQDTDDELEDDLGSIGEGNASHNDLDESEDDLNPNPLAARPSKSRAQAHENVISDATAKHPTRKRQAMFLSDDIDSEMGEGPSRPTAAQPLPPEETTQVIPQALLVRLLHEAFEDNSTKIDKNAIQVLQKYIDVFVRETIERARLEKEEACERGEVGDMDKDWLDLEDLEKVAPAMLLDF